MRKRPGRELRPAMQPKPASTSNSPHPNQTLNERALYNGVQDYCLRQIQDQMNLRSSKQPLWVRQNIRPLAIISQDPQLKNLFMTLPAKQQVTMLRAINSLKALNLNQLATNANSPKSKVPSQEDLRNPSSALNMQLGATNLMLNQAIENQMMNDDFNQTYQNQIIKNQNDQAEAMVLQDDFNENLNQEMENQKQQSSLAEPSPSFRLDEEEFKKIDEMKKPLEKTHEAEVFKKAIDSFSHGNKEELIKTLVGAFEEAEADHGATFKPSSIPTLTR